MMVNIKQKPLRGTVKAPVSKSDAHRKLICAALSDKLTVMSLPEKCADIDATIRCLTALGAKIEEKNSEVTVTPISEVPAHATLDCGESGSTLRFMLPVAAALGCSARFVGAGRLPERPVGVLAEQMEQHGVAFSSHRLPFEISGKLTGGDFTLPGNVSSQFITGLLLALPMAGGGSIELTSALESAAYVEMTRAAMADFGVTVHDLTVENEKYVSPRQAAIDGDWSSAAFLLAAGAVGGEVTATGLNMNSIQGDKAVIDVLRRMGAEVETDENRVTVRKNNLHGVEIDVRDIPDLLPVLSIAAAFAQGETDFVNAERLRIKESDRIESTSQMLTALGIKNETGAGFLKVYGGEPKCGTVNGFADHRIVMSAAVAGSVCSCTVTDAQATEKSYPAFWRDFEALGGLIEYK